MFLIDNNVTSTSDCWYLNNYTKHISYKSTSVGSIHAKVSNSKSKYPILDKLGFETSKLQQHCIDIIRLKSLIKKISCVFENNYIQIIIYNWSSRCKKITEDSFCKSSTIQQIKKKCVMFWLCGWNFKILFSVVLKKI